MFTRWRSRPVACRTCPKRKQCTTSKSPTFGKEVSFTLTQGKAQRVAEQIDRLKKERAVEEPKQKQKSPPKDDHRIPRWKPTPKELNSGELRVTAPMLVPSELRNRLRIEFAGAQVDVHVTTARKRQKRKNAFLACNPEERQQRRKSWTWRSELNQLPDDADVEIVLHAGAKLAKMIDLKKRASNAA